MMKKRVIASLIAMMMVLSVVPVRAEEFIDGTESSIQTEFTDALCGYAPQADVTNAEEFPEPTGIPIPTVTPDPNLTPQPTPVPVESGWVIKKGKHYWRQEDGTYLQGAGVHILNGKKYYLSEKGSRVEGCWKKISRKYYYFQKNGTMREKQGWIEYKGKKYYTNTDGSKRCSGFAKVKGKSYYLDKKGRLVKNKIGYKIKGKYYDIDNKGVAVKVSEKKVKCRNATKSFIKRHTRTGMSNATKFRTCYNQLLWYMNYRPTPFNEADFQGKDWPYNWAIDVFETNTGDCFGFACSVAMCAKELGYDPEIIITTGDHGFVIIDGLYYDNMGGLFGASSHDSYRTYKRYKL